jgi:signal transduction histidine kinase/CHASE3 domain sensor protein
MAVVVVLGLGLARAWQAHADLESEFERLVQHDLKLTYDAEVLLRLTSDLETGKRGFLLTGDPSFLTPYENAKRELDTVLKEAQDTAEPGKEDARVADFGRAVHDWIVTISDPQIEQRKHGVMIDLEKTGEGKARTDEMRAICNELRADAERDADERQTKAFASAAASRKWTSGALLAAIAMAAMSGIWIARDLASAAAQLEAALLATGRLEPLPPMPDRADELGSVGRSLVKMAALLKEKDASLRRTLSERERALVELTHAHEALAKRDADTRAYAEFVRALKTLDLDALSTSGLAGLVRLAGGHVGVVYVLDGANRLVPLRAMSPDGRIGEDKLMSPEGLPRAVMQKGEPLLLSGDMLPAPPKVDLGVADASIRWVLAQPIAAGDEAAGALIVGGLEPLSPERADLLLDGARQLAIGVHNAWTHDRLREKSVMLTEQGETLTRANMVKTQFLASMSHELRTPLSAILGFADLLANSPKESLSPRAKESLERIKRNGEHLLGLINDVLDLAKAETGHLDMRLSAVNVGQLARASVAEVDSLRVGKELKLTVDVPEMPLTTLTDAQRVKQILLNLLSNAIKFTEQGEVSLVVRVQMDELRIDVTDTGRGIPAHAMTELFQEFHQLDGGDGKRYPGTGMGLALSRRLARALGGEIEVRSREGFGSTFTLVLPMRIPLEHGSDSSVTSVRVLA